MYAGTEQGVVNYRTLTPLTPLLLAGECDLGVTLQLCGPMGAQTDPGRRLGFEQYSHQGGVSSLVMCKGWAAIREAEQHPVHPPIGVVVSHGEHSHLLSMRTQ